MPISYNILDDGRRVNIKVSGRFDFSSHQEFRDAYAMALKAPNEAEKAKWFGRCQRIIAEDAVNGYLFSAPNLPAMKAGVMGWWENYPTIALDCTRVWWKK